MRILYISQYYPPEVNAPAVRVSEISRRWAQQGHAVTVVTAFPNHPNGIVPEEYRRKLLAKETDHGVSVLRSLIYAAPNAHMLRRILSYLSFMFSAIISGMFRSGKQDMVIATSPQLLVALAGYVVSRFKRAPFVFEVRDIWPEEIVAVGAMRRGLAFRLLEKLEMFLYRRAALIVALAQGTVDILTSRGVPASKIALVPHGVDFDSFSSQSNDHALRDTLNLNGHFLVTYIGTHGMAHNLQTVLKAADRLRDHNDIRFLFVGDGADRDNLLRTQAEQGLDNVTLVPQQQRDSILRYYATSDLCLVPLRRAQLFTKNIPSKLYEIMAAGKPILIGTEGESRRLVLRARAGLAYEPDNDADLADKIMHLFHNRQLVKQLGDNGRRFADAHCRQDDIADRYGKILANISGRK
jgi:glycosyltransferase involved in cell wall biosynthesis